MNRPMRGALSIIISAACLVFFASGPLAGESIEKMYQDGLFKETSLGDLEGAIEVYRNIIVKHVENREFAARAQLRMGICYEALGRKEDAVRAYQAVVTRFPGQATLVAEASARLSALGPVYAKKEGRDSPELLEAYYLGEFAYSNSDYNLCINSMKKVLALKPKDRDTEIWARDFLARAYEALGQEKRAAGERRRIWEMAEEIKLPSKSFAEAYDLAKLYNDDPYLRKSFVGPSLMGLAAFKMGNYDEAVKHLARALEAGEGVSLPLLNKTYVVLGWSYEKKGMKDEAREQYRKVLIRFEREGLGPYEEMDPYIFLAREPKFPNSDAWHYYRQGDAYTAAGKYDKAVTSLDKAISLSGPFPWMRVYMNYLAGLASFKAGRPASAVAHLASSRKILEGLKENEPVLTAAVEAGLVDTHYSDVVAAELYRQGNFEGKIGRFKHAIQNFSKALSHAKTPGMEARIRLSLAELYRSQGKEKEAKKEYDRILELDRTVSGAERKEIQVAVDMAKAPDLYESKAYSLYKKGQTSFKAGDYDKAMEYFEKAMAKKPEWHWLNAWIHVWLGTACMEKWWEDERKYGPPDLRSARGRGAGGGEAKDAEPLIDRCLGEFQYVLEYAWGLPEPHSEKLRAAIDAARQEGMPITREYSLYREAEKMLREGGDPEKARRLLEKAEPGPHWLIPRIVINQAVIRKAMGDDFDAEELPRHAIEFTERDERVREDPVIQASVAQAYYPDFLHSALGATYRKAITDYEDGNYGLAAGAFEAVLKSKKKVPLVRARADLMLGRIQESRGREEEAQKSYERVLALKEREHTKVMARARKEAHRRLVVLKRPPQQRGKLVAEGKPISWREAYDYLGEVKAVRGRIYNAFREPESGTVFLELWPEPERFPPERYPTAIIYKPDLDKFPGKTEDHYRGKDFEITGLLKRVGFRLIMRVRDPSQIKPAKLSAKEIEKVTERPEPEVHELHAEWYAFDKPPSKSTISRERDGAVKWQYSVPKIVDETWAAITADIPPTSMEGRTVVIRLESKKGHPIDIGLYSRTPGFSKESDDETFVFAMTPVELKRGSQEIRLDPSSLEVPEWWRREKKAPRVEFFPGEVRAIEFSAQVEKDVGPVSDTIKIHAIILK